MSDEGFHLTPVDIRRYDFGSALRGYDKTRVDQFRDQVAAEVERLARANQELEQKSKGLVEQLRAFRERDKALNDALVSAQQLRAEIREQADREAQLLMREARAQVEKDVEGIRADARRLEDEIQGLVRVRRTYLSQLRTMVERQLAEIETAEATPLPQPPMGSSSSGQRREDGRRDEPKQTAHPTPAWLDSLVKE
jgi:DivIVA domain-containing protein